MNKKIFSDFFYCYLFSQTKDKIFVILKWLSRGFKNGFELKKKFEILSVKFITKKRELKKNSGSDLDWS